MRRSSVGGFFAMLLLAGLPAVIYFSAIRGMADVVAQEPRYEIDRWRAGKLAPDSLKLNAMQAELHKALELAPQNPNLMEDLGRFYAARVERGSPYEPAVREIRQQSLLYFRQAAAQRPTSGHAWANVALMKFRLGEFDLEYTLALEQALRRAPWEPQVQLLAIEIGLAGWQVLADSTREKLKQAIRSQGEWQLVNQKAPLLALLKRYRRADLNCLLEPGPNACGAS